MAAKDKANIALVYWARSRVLEYLNQVMGDLPAGIRPTLGPDATGVGWVYEYALVDETGQNSLADLRTLQDWTLRYYLQNTPGVAEVASIGGFVREYQVDVDPNKLLAYQIPLPKVVMAIRESNNDVGGRVIEFGETEYMVKGVGYIKTLADIEKVVVGVDAKGTPITIKEVANVHFGPDMRRAGHRRQERSRGRHRGDALRRRCAQDHPSRLFRVAHGYARNADAGRRATGEGPSNELMKLVKL